MLITPDFIPTSFNRFIVIEGLNGSGKSTLIKAIAPKLEALDKRVLETREPGGSRLGLKLREILLSNSRDRPSKLSELFLFAADRAEHVESVLQPALAENKIVLCDRYFYSTIAFQGFGRNLPLDIVEATCDLAIQNLLPDLVIMLDIEPELGLRRNSEKADDAFETEQVEFHDRVRKGFLSLAEQRKEAFLVLDASKSPEHIANTAWRVIEKFIMKAK